MSQKILLSICIPTYNRDSYINLLLSEIVSSIRCGGLEEVIEVLVLDNCSKDGTWNTLIRHAKSASCVKPFKNKINIGAEANIIRCMYEARGDYTWLLSDHQKIFPGKLVELVGLLRHKSPDFCCIAIGQWSAPLFTDNEIIELGQLTRSEVGALLFTWGNISSLLGRTEYFLSGLRRSVMIAYYNYPHVSFFQDLSQKTKVIQIKGAIEFRSLEEGKFVKNYDPYRPCFINNIRIVKNLIRRTDIYLKASDFQTKEYTKSFAVESIRLIVNEEISLRVKIKSIFGAIWANWSGIVPGKIIIVALISLLLMALPQVLRRNVLIIFMSLLSPKSGLLKEVKNIK